MIASQGGAIEPTDTLLLGKAGGMAAARRTLATTICRITDPTLVARPRPLRDASTVMRFQPAHQSMINRRFDGRASCPARNSPKPAPETEPPIHTSATCRGGHKSGLMPTTWYPRLSFSMMRFVSAVQTKGLGLRLCSLR
jgi:hypothetical protein